MFVCGFNAKLEQVQPYKVPPSVRVEISNANSIKDRLVAMDVTVICTKIVLCWCRCDNSVAADKNELWLLMAFDFTSRYSSEGKQSKY